VEFALVLPLLALLVFGTIEFGWAFSQNLDVRHGAREAARLFVVDYDDGNPATSPTQGIVDEVCARMDDHEPTTITVSAPSGTSTGDYVEVQVTRTHSGLTGFLEFAMPASLDSNVEMRLEQDASWVAGTYACP
jgi:Flp pilus assembly protein TadG